MHRAEGEMFRRVLVTVVLLNVIICEEETIKYYLTTPDHPEKLLLTSGAPPVINPGYDTVILVHGWTESSDSLYYTTMPEAYMKRGNTNVICVDWSCLSSKNYFNAPTYMQTAGKQIATFITELTDKHGVPLPKIHVVSHSLGCHLAGYVGKYFRKMAGGRKLPRITGLDPSGLVFNLYRFFPHKRLDAKDADIVDVLYTNMGVIGMDFKVGSVNFFANGGIRQPGCPLDHDNHTKTNFCSHQRSVSYFLGSINSDGFIGRRCKKPSDSEECRDGVSFGEGMPTNASGDYFFDTNDDPPYEKF